MIKELHIAIVNDDEDDNLILKDVLETISNNISLRFFHDGFDLLANADEVQIPDLIFLDIVMPKMNGIDCLKRVKHHALLKNIPIVIYTGVHNEDIIKDCFDSGANVFIEKSVTYAGTRRLIEKVLSVDWKNKDVPEQHQVLVEVED
ncbi:MAG: response regulator receiver [Segetibacter sp.]|nr:response regulator receiver [Segetibacter sp.]